MSRLQFIAMRLVKTALVALAVVLLSFFLIRLAPGDAATVMAGQSGYADEAFMKSLRAEYGLDKPLPVQLATYLGTVARGDLGTSYVRRQPVLDIILERLPNTLLLDAFALVVAIAGGVWLGAAAARRPGSAGDAAVTFMSMLFYSVPQFWLGMMAVLVFSVWLAWLPPFGIETMGADYTGLARLADVAKHMILPGMTLALYYLASYARLTRTAMIEVADQDFVKTARAKGIRESQVARRHILRNALIPLITFAGLQASILVGGSVLVENVFSWPGIGTLAYEAVTARDNPLLLGIFIVTAVLVSLFNLVTDIAYSIADPRVEIGGMKRFARVFLARPTALFGLAVFAAIVVIALAAPILFARGPFTIVGMPLLPPGAPGLLAGSDVLGRDMAVGLAYGARISLLVGITSTLGAVGIGVALGAVAGYYGGVIDDLLMRVTEFFQIIPSFVLLMVLVAFLQPSLASTVIGIALISWPQVARVVRGEFLSLRSREFVQAARTLGMRDAAIIFTQILPNALPPIVVVSSMMVGSAILTESALSFLGLGDPNLLSWGSMIGGSRSAMWVAWWTTVLPGLSIMVTVLALNFIGDGLNDALNPRRGR